MKVNINDHARARLTETGKILAERAGLRFAGDGLVECTLWVLMGAMQAEFQYPHMGGPFEDGNIEVIPAIDALPSESEMPDGKPQ